MLLLEYLHLKCYPTVVPQTFRLISSSQKHGLEMAGHPVQVMFARDDHTFELDMPALESILLTSSVKDTPVVVVATVGTFRKGKSFLLNFLVRYLHSEGSMHWQGSPDLPLQGFPWRGGTERETTGIMMWSKPFIVNLLNGKKVAVLMMDMQGVFDEKTSIKECATVFSLGALLSSVLIYNLQADIHEDNLQALQMFADYGKLAQKNNVGTPFQKLLFLIRDWPHAYEMPYGTSGGEMLLEKRFKVLSNQAKELQEIRRHIRSFFVDVSCFLMPHPGLKAMSDPRFEGKLKDMEPDFVASLKDLIPVVLAPQNLLVKQIGGVELKGSDLLNYFKTYMDIFKGAQLPQPETIFTATSKVHHLLAINRAKSAYTNLMCQISDDTKLEDADRIYRGARSSALKTYDAFPKMGSAPHHCTYRIQLDQEMEDDFKKIKERITEKKELEENVSSLLLTYQKKMEKIISNSTLRIENLNSEHNKVKSEVCKSFTDNIKHWKKENQENYLKKLSEAVEEKYNVFRERNNGKPTQAEHEMRVKLEEAERRAKAHCVPTIYVPSTPIQPIPSFPQGCSQPRYYMDEMPDFTQLRVSSPTPSGSGVTQKHVNFLSQATSSAPVTAIPGIGKVLGGRLASSGIDSTASMMQQYKACKGNPVRFQSWMRETCGANSRQSRDCYNALSEKSATSGGRSSGGGGGGGRSSGSRSGGGRRR